MTRFPLTFTMAASLALLVSVVPSFSFASSFQCESSFAGKAASALDTLLVETSSSFPHTEKYLMKTNAETGAAFKVRLGRFGASPETFEDTIDLSKAKIEGLQTRETSWQDEGASLELHIREPQTMNDIWKVPLASEMDAMAFLIAQKFGLKIQVTDDHVARGFVVHAGASSSLRDGSFKELILGSKDKIVGVSTARVGLTRDSVLTLLVESADSKQVVEIQSANSQALKVAKTLILKGHALVALEGIRYRLK